MPIYPVILLLLIMRIKSWKHDKNFAIEKSSTAAYIGLYIINDRILDYFN